MLVSRRISLRQHREQLGAFFGNMGFKFRFDLYGHLAEAVRFELTNGCPLPVFKTGAIDHSATLPGVMKGIAFKQNQIRIWFSRLKNQINDPGQRYRAF